MMPLVLQDARRNRKIAVFVLLLSTSFLPDNILQVIDVNTESVLMCGCWGVISTGMCTHMHIHT